MMEYAGTMCKVIIVYDGVCRDRVWGGNELLHILCGVAGTVLRLLDIKRPTSHLCFYTCDSILEFDCSLLTTD